MIKFDKCFHRSMKRILWENRVRAGVSLFPPLVQREETWRSSFLAGPWLPFLSSFPSSMKHDPRHISNKLSRNISLERQHLLCWNPLILSFNTLGQQQLRTLWGNKKSRLSGHSHRKYINIPLHGYLSFSTSFLPLPAPHPHHQNKYFPRIYDKRFESKSKPGQRVNEKG